MNNLAIPFRFMAVEGNIGAGKTTLATAIARRYESGLLLESFAENAFLPLFYANPERYAFPLELSFLADRYRQLSGELAPVDLTRQSVVSDYLLEKSRLFARITLPPEEYRLFEKLFAILQPQLPQPDLLIFLMAPVPVLQDRIRARGRAYEQQIEDDYLLRVQAAYDDWLKTVTGKVLVVDTTRVHFGEEKELDLFFSFLESGWKADRRFYPG